MRKLITIAMVAMLATPAMAQEFKAAIGRENNNRCHMDGCYPFTLTSSTMIGKTGDGELYRVTETSREDDYAETKDGSDYDRPPIKRGTPESDEFYVFCSKTRPEFFYKDAGKWTSTALRPGDEVGVFGVTELVHMQYWAACHNYIARDGASPRMAKKLGYHLRPNDENYRETRAPEEALK
jgi:hypothetical protein